MSIHQDRTGKKSRKPAGITRTDGLPADPETASMSGEPGANDVRQTTSLDQFLDELRDVHEESHTEIVSRRSAGDGPRDVKQLAQELVRSKALTKYQAAAIYQGKSKGLFVGPYIVLDKLGKGGMGTVFKVRHRDHRDAVFALKVLRLSFSRKNKAVVERFRKEAEALARIEHPNIVWCFEPVSVVNGAFYHVMEFVDGQDLKSLVETNGRFPVWQAIDVLLQAARGLQFAHSRRIIHRDIKPANLMLDRTGTLRILDFGLARVVLADSWIPDSDGGVDTATGAVMGTIPYMSPEQASDSKRADARSDIYSLGCTLHYLLTGRPPYEGRTWSEMFLAHRENPIPSLKAVRHSVPDHLDRLFKRMLAKNPADRPQTMASVIAKIELALDESRARPGSSHTIPIRPDEPDERDVGPNIDLSVLQIDLPATAGRNEIYYTGRRLRPPAGPWDLSPLVRYLALAGALTALLILLIEWVMLGVLGAELQPVVKTVALRVPRTSAALGQLSPEISVSSLGCRSD
jgi:serine/threonine protein kinase